MNVWSRRGFIAHAGVASAGAVAVTGGAVGLSQAATITSSGRDLPLLSSYVAGANRTTVRKVPDALGFGRQLYLVREPDNDYDARAVSVWTEDGTKLGYVPRIHNQPLANLMDAGIAIRAAVGHVRHLPRPEIRIDIRLPVA